MKRRRSCQCCNRPRLRERLPPLPEIPTDILNNLDPEYSIVFNDLITSIKNTERITEFEQILDNFAEKYLILPELWRYHKWFVPMDDASDEYRDRYLAQFYYPYLSCKNIDAFDKSGLVIWVELSDYSKLSILNLMGYQDKARYLLDHPHKYLNTAFNFYEAYGDKILTQKEYFKYKTSLKYQEEIIAAENSVEDLFKCYAKIEDKRIAIQNIEILLSENPCNKWLWHSYFEYTKNDLPKAYLDILERYTKFFISETDVRELYEQEKKRIESMPNFAEMKSLPHFLIKQQKTTLSKNDKKRIFSTTFKSYHPQSFSFPMPIIRYLLVQANPRQKNLLFETCKHLFLLSPTPICCNITFSSTRSTHNCIHGQSLRLSRSPPTTCQNLFLTKTLTIDSLKYPKTLTQIISRISQCHIWSLDVVGQIVSWKNLKFLLQADTVKRFSFVHGKIVTDAENQDLIPIEDVIEALPCANSIRLNSAAFTQNTFEKLAALNSRQCQFKFFEIGNVDCSFNFADFEKFVKVHFEAKAEINLVVESNRKSKAFENITKLAKNLLESWTPKETKPDITVV